MNYALYQKALVQIWAFMVLWFMRRKYVNDLPYFQRFCDNPPPLEEDLDLHLNKLEFPSCKKCLYQVWLKLARCFILNYSVQYTNVKIVSPRVPTLTSRTIICISLNMHFVCKLSCKYELFWVNGSQGVKESMTSRNFCIFTSISPLKRTWPFIWTI
jgi:hypothetical protein